MTHGDGHAGVHPRCFETGVVQSVADRNEIAVIEMAVVHAADAKSFTTRKKLHNDNDLHVEKTIFGTAVDEWKDSNPC